MQQIAHMFAQVAAMDGHTNMFDDMTVGIQVGGPVAAIVFQHAVFEMATVEVQPKAPVAEEHVEFDDE